MFDANCIFCKIVAGQLPATIITQNEQVIVIQDRFPKADIHWLVIPKIHIEDLRAIQPADKALLGDLLAMVQEVVAEAAHNAPFKLVANNGREVGQIVFHLHFHILAGNIRELV